MNLKNLNQFFVLLIIGFSACDKTGVNEEVTVCKSINDSSFSIKELVGLEGNQKLFEANIIVASRSLTYLVANDSLANEYSWRFSSSPQVFYGRSVGVVFNQAIGNEKIKLTIKRNPDNPCFGALSAQSEYSREIALVEVQSNPLLGSYYGYNASDKSSYFIVQILQNGIKNIPLKTEGSYYLQNEIIYGSSAFYIAAAGTFDPAYGAYATEGFGYLTNHNKGVEIDYKYKKPLGSSMYSIIKDTFYGIKQ
jgi:hypothetical protein